MMNRVRTHSTLEALRPLFTGTFAPRERLARARPMLDGAHPTTMAFAAAAREATRGNRGGFGMAVRSAARLDGATIAEAQQYFGLFNPTRRRELSAWQFDALDDARVPELVARQAAATLEVIDPNGGEPLDTWVFPADHANAHSMLCLHGLEAWGDMPQGIAVQVWPSPGTLNRLGPVVTRATALSVRSRTAWPTGRDPTLADHLVREGLAALAVSLRFPNLPRPWAAPFTPSPDWTEALARVAAVANVASYADFPVNIYGVVAPAGAPRMPAPTAFDDDDLTYARAVLRDDLGATDPTRIAGYLYGDVVVSMAGHPPVGMSTFAGIAASYAIVSEAVMHRRIHLPAALCLPTADLLDEAFG